jgi:hypothetical protein
MLTMPSKMTQSTDFYEHMTDQSDIFLFYIKEAHWTLPYTSTIIYDTSGRGVGVEFFNDVNGTVCQFYKDMTVMSIHNNLKFEYIPVKGTYLNDAFVYRHFNARDFASFWQRGGMQK